MKTQKKLLALLLVLCMFFSMSGNVFAADTDVVDVPDETFKAYLNGRLGPDREADADITKSDMKKITKIELPRNISNLEGIQYCTELTWFRANGVGTPENLQLLGNCTKLTFLAVMSSYLDDISFVANLTELTYLNLYNDEISDISAIKNLNKLTVLDLMKNHIVDLSPLSEFYPQMTHLYGLNETATLTLECNREESGYCMIDNPVIGVDANPVAPNSLPNCEYDAATNTFKVPTGTESFSFKTTQPTVAESGDFQNNFTTSVTVNINHTPQTDDPMTTGDLTITKSFAGLAEDEIPVEDIYFTFTVDGEEVEDALYLEEFECENGEYSITISASVGTYTIEEHDAEVDGYDHTCDIPDSFEVTENGYTLALENIYASQPARFAKRACAGWLFHLQLSNIYSIIGALNER